MREKVKRAKKERILLVEPDFPIPKKSKNHSGFLPIGLLKLASYNIKKGNDVFLVRGDKSIRFRPDKIYITSLFTYWAEYVWRSVHYYKALYPKAKVVVGGIYASLMPDHCRKSGCDEVFIGVHKPAEHCEPAYHLINNGDFGKIDYQIVHASRGCSRSCSFCGTWKIEPKNINKKTIKNEIMFRNVVFYDNNFLSNPHIENILAELIELKKKKKILWCESQSGFDGRILLKRPYLAKMIRDAGFRYPRIAWDWQCDDYPKIEKQIELFKEARYRSKDLFIFMLYNWNLPFGTMELKRKKCWQWKVQIADCRFRPLNQTFDYFRFGKEQTNLDYFIHQKWTDREVKKFRQNVRRQNICVRQDVSFYSKKLENKQIKKAETRFLKRLGNGEIKQYLDDAWFPNK